jgi:hypothetical protein
VDLLYKGHKQEHKRSWQQAKMKHTILSILTLLLLGFTTDNTVSEEVKNKMYKKAINHFSTAPYYVVIKVKNLQTGEIKEVCTEAPFVHGALDRENCSNKSDFKNKLINKERYFEFNCDSALWNIGYDLYTKSELSELENKLNLDSLVSSARKGELTSITFTETRKYQRMYAHLMFNRGIMMTRGCFAGNICSVQPYEK